MIQMALASIGNGAHALQIQRLSGPALARRMLGLAVVSSGYAVIVTHALSHMFGG
ncbi:hypothetical protein [Paraburkholderia rhizosphaerae]|uniref:Uncharacterized protein n=1 Tax=Paraburkholderia rhizosphaerae TaxID=480658 RepID=A0A4R8LUC1_9BURK|nr:hypothetical protein [Paraburkholderia rhizosphaerae]TDY50385.1 hypothetical protein BX592_109170 [Paraburkholderia rhizosphaerae]